MYYHLVTLGCQMNKSDSERVRTVIESMGYVWTDHESEAGLIGILACSVRQRAIDRVYTRIHRWNLMKHDRPLLTFVTGCVLPADRKKFLKLFDLIFTMNELSRFPDMVRQYGVVTPAAPGAAGSPCAGRPVMDGLWQVAATPASTFEAYVPIQNGCDNFCTFCAVPYTRGREVSRQSADILAEVERLVEQDYKSITLLGQNVNSYGRDRKGQEATFAQLLRRIGELGEQSGKRFRVYFTSPHPRDMTDDVIEVMASYDCIGKQVHLPIQSGDDDVLRRMNRQHTVGRYRRIMETIERLLPEATLFTDIIVGFSGETEEEFEHTRAIMEEFRFHMAYVAMYSPRPGAVSSRWEDDIPHDEKRRRLHILNDVLVEQADARNRELVGRTLPVLITGRHRKGQGLMGVTEGKISVLVDTHDEERIGDFLDVTIRSASDLAMAGEPAMAGVAAK